MTSTEERYALAAARLLRDQMPPIQPAHQPSDRDRVVAAMELALAHQARRRRTVWAGVGTLAAAAGVILVLKLVPSGDSLLVEQSVGKDNILFRQGQTRALSAPMSLLEGDEIRSGQAGRASLGLGRGTRLELASASQVRLLEAGTTRRLYLLRGRVDANVAKLQGRERLLVSTPDGEVEVRGTRFSVQVADAPAGCGGARQRSTVEVQQGAVWVRSLGTEKVLTAGQSFTRKCAAPSSTQPQPVIEPAASAPEEPRRPIPSALAPRRRGPLAETTRTPVPAPEPESRLAEQNDLLSSAMAAARAGQHESALRHLDTLLARFPEGPLSETARIERQRIKAARKTER